MDFKNCTAWNSFHSIPLHLRFKFRLRASLLPNLPQSKGSPFGDHRVFLGSLTGFAGFEEYISGHKAWAPSAVKEKDTEPAVGEEAILLQGVAPLNVLPQISDFQFKFAGLPECEGTFGCHGRSF